VRSCTGRAYLSCPFPVLSHGAHMPSCVLSHGTLSHKFSGLMIDHAPTRLLPSDYAHRYMQKMQIQAQQFAQKEARNHYVDIEKKRPVSTMHSAILTITFCHPSIISRRHNAGCVEGQGERVGSTTCCRLRWALALLGLQHRAFTRGIHSGDSLRGFTQGIHSGDSLRGFTQGIHSGDSLRGFTQEIHSGDSLRGFTQEIHSGDSLRGFTQEIQSHHCTKQHLFLSCCRSIKSC
jgi:hypothetical protein